MLYPIANWSCGFNADNFRPTPVFFVFYWFILMSSVLERQLIVEQANPRFNRMKSQSCVSSTKPITCSDVMKTSSKSTLILSVNYRVYFNFKEVDRLTMLVVIICLKYTKPRSRRWMLHFINRNPIKRICVLSINFIACHFCFNFTYKSILLCPYQIFLCPFC